MGSRRFITLTVVITMVLCAGMAKKAMPQETSEIGFEGWGIRAGLSSDPDQIYGGFHFNLGEFAKDVRFRPTVELGFGDDQMVLQLLGEVHYVFSKLQTWKPYVGGGLGLTYTDFDDDHPRDGSDTEPSLSAIAGIETQLNLAKKLFFEFKIGVTNDDPDIKLGLGLSW